MHCCIAAGDAHVLVVVDRVDHVDRCCVVLLVVMTMMVGVVVVLLGMMRGVMMVVLVGDLLLCDTCVYKDVC